MRGDTAPERGRLWRVEPAQLALRMARDAPSRRQRQCERPVAMPELLGQVQSFAPRQVQGPWQARSL